MIVDSDNSTGGEYDVAVVIGIEIGIVVEIVPAFAPAPVLAGVEVGFDSDNQQCCCRCMLVVVAWVLHCFRADDLLASHRLGHNLELLVYLMQDLSDFLESLMERNHSVS